MGLNLSCVLRTSKMGLLCVNSPCSQVLVPAWEEAGAGPDAVGNGRVGDPRGSDGGARLGEWHRGGGLGDGEAEFRLPQRFPLGRLLVNVGQDREADAVKRLAVDCC
jgi:hypothetical protein